MNRNKILILTLVLCVLIGGYPKAEYRQDNSDLPDQNDVETVMIALTHLDVNDQTPDVNDQTLELRYRIVNRSADDIWVCSDVSLFHQYQQEVYMEKDDETLMIRKRFDVPTDIFWVFQPVSIQSKKSNWTITI